MSTKQTPYILGLDIGIGSVGWGIVDQDRKIVDAGVRIFPEADKKNNEGRRGFRSSRRLLRRRKHRLDRVKKLLQNYHLIESAQNPPTSTDPYSIRAKGLYNKLTKDELAISLLHLAKRRGIHNVDINDEESTSNNELSTKDQISKNNKLLTEKYICELQLERLHSKDENIHVRGHQNRFKTSDFIKEANKIIDTQSKYYNELTSEFKKNYIKLLETRREYYEGPGEGSPFGWEQDINKWYEQMMGKCSYFPDELRSVKAAYSAQLFNLLNDLNNLTLTRPENDKLTNNEKKEMVDTLFHKTRNVTLKRIAKFLNIQEHDIKGYRVTPSRKPEFTKLDIYHDIKKINKESVLLEEPEKLDGISEILTIYQTKDDKLIELKKLDLKVTDREISEIADLNYTGTHSLSLKLIHMLLPDLLETTKNQMELISEYGYRPKKIDYQGLKYIPTDQIDDFILSPVVKRSFKQSIGVINAIIKKYGYPAEIVIELAREKNSADKKKIISDLNKKNKKLNSEVRKKLESLDVDASRGLFNMLKLWHLQDGLCLYSIDSIEIDELVNKPYLFEIDHIIPRSVSFDDSFNNKVLVYKDENQKKLNRTPFQYLSSGNGQISYEKYKSNVLQLAKSSTKIPKKKLNYLLEERDINKYDVQKEFINRNLVDTRYATREIMTTLNTFFKTNDQPVKVKSINGSFTNYLRKLWDMNKDRGVDFKHHAEDALICAMASHIFEHKDVFKAQNKIISEDRVVDAETGEILTEDEFSASFTEKIGKVKQIRQYKDYKYSHKVDKKLNRQLMNDTLYSTRVKDNQEFRISKYTNLYDKDQEKLKKQIFKNPERLLMYHHDPKTFNKLLNIMKRYQEAKNPLYQFHQETGKYLTKYSKKDDGPIVKSIKYYYEKLGEHHDLSHKFCSNSKKIVTQSVKPFRMDVYLENNIYKFVTIRYNDFREEKDKYILSEDKYQSKLEGKGIEDLSSFQFSLYKNELLLINNIMYRLIGINQDKLNRIEVNRVEYNYKDFCLATNQKYKRQYIYIGKNTKIFKKTHSDILGKRYQVQKKNKPNLYYLK